MFEKLRHSMDDLLARATRPEERREVVGRMKQALVHARVGLEDLGRGVDETRARVATERRELETISRRKGLATGIGDEETVQVAERFERQHAERLAVLEAKLQAQEAEQALVTREVAEMTDELRRAALGGPAAASMPADAADAGSAGRASGPGGAAPGTAAGDEDPLDDGAALRGELDAVARGARRARQEADADARLAELKRRMGR